MTAMEFEGRTEREAVAKAAAELGVNRTTLYNKMKKYNIFKEEKERYSS